MERKYEGLVWLYPVHFCLERFIQLSQLLGLLLHSGHGVSCLDVCVCNVLKVLCAASGLKVGLLRLIQRLKVWARTQHCPLANALLCLAQVGLFNAKKMARVQMDGSEKRRRRNKGV